MKLIRTDKSSNILGNIKWYILKTNKDFPKMKYSVMVSTLINATILLLTSSISTIIVWGLQQKLNFSLFSFIIISICVGLGVLIMIQSIYKTWITWTNANFRMQLSVKDGFGFIASPFEESIDTNVQRIRNRSSKHGYGDDGSGVDVLWPSLINLVSTGFTIILISLSTIMINYKLPFLIIIFTAISIYIMSVFNKKQ